MSDLPSDLIDAICRDALLLMRKLPIGARAAVYVSCCVHEVSPVGVAPVMAEGMKKALEDNLREVEHSNWRGMTCKSVVRLPIMRSRRTDGGGHRAK
jgi:hypothetical protein